jgi:hypothetical protein
MTFPLRLTGAGRVWMVLAAAAEPVEQIGPRGVEEVIAVQVQLAHLGLAVRRRLRSGR